jgi:hypothetical protein
VNWVAVLQKFSMTTSRDVTSQKMCPDGKLKKNLLKSIFNPEIFL